MMGDDTNKGRGPPPLPPEAQAERPRSEPPPSGAELLPAAGDWSAEPPPVVEGVGGYARVPRSSPPASGLVRGRHRRRKAPQVVVHAPPAVPLRQRELDIEAFPAGALTRVHIEIVADGLANDILVPVLVARGRRPGPVFGITAAVHGNELNGIPVIHSLIQRLDTATLRGTVVGVCAVNVPGLNNHQRHFVDGRDLNHIFPGDSRGDVAQVYAHRVVQRILRRFDRLVDLHTASFGRVNSLYVRADMTDPRCARMAYLQRPQIIVHNPAGDRTLRGTAMRLGIPAITVEIGDPQLFQARLVKSTLAGVHGMLADAKMIAKRPLAQGDEPLICERSYWLYTDRGGLLEVLPAATQMVQKGETVALLRNAFGDVIREYAAPEAGVVVGHSVNPVGQTGARILHIGVVAPRDHSFLRR